MQHFKAVHDIDISVKTIYKYIRVLQEKVTMEGGGQSTRPGRLAAAQTTFVQTRKRKYRDRCDVVKCMLASFSCSQLRWERGMTR